MRAKGSRWQILIILISPLLMTAICSVGGDKPMTRFDFWLGVPILALNIGFYTNMFLCTIEDRAKVEAEWKEKEFAVKNLAEKEGYDRSAPPSPRFRFRTVLVVMAFFYACFLVESILLRLRPEISIILAVLNVPASIWYGLRISRQGGSIQELQLHLPKRFRA